MKKHRKLGAALLAICLMASVSMTAFAENIISPADNGNAQITAKTTIPGQPAYTVTIPSTIPVGDIEKAETSTVKSTAFTITAADVANLGSKKIDVTISTQDAAFHLTSGANKLPYQVYKEATGGTALASGDLFASFTANGTQAGRIDIDLKDIPAAGDYVGTLTFTIALAEAGVIGGLGDFGGGGAW